jgi:hypothetical protein
MVKFEKKKKWNHLNAEEGVGEEKHSMFDLILNNE